MAIFQIAAFVIIVLLGIVIVLLLIQGDLMEQLNQAVARVLASIAAANTKIDALKLGQVDQATIDAAVANLNAAADTLDAKVNS